MEKRSTEVRVERTGYYLSQADLEAAVRDWVFKSGVYAIVRPEGATERVEVEFEVNGGQYTATVTQHWEYGVRIPSKVNS